ncbi:MAG: SH3 domain-containing protein [Fibrobacteres bacterium]|nr:SH3 domain-containing protein [Fibrobacterota bacterium]
MRVRKLLLCLSPRILLGTLGLFGVAPVAAQVYASLPDNPIAFGNCTARVKVDIARLRSGPSLDSKILGVRKQDEPLHVLKVVGKWVQVETVTGDTAYMAAYLLAFPASDLLEQWKRESPAPSVGKKARVKWASVEFRKYPSRLSASLGHFDLGDEVAVLTDMGNGWSFVESRKTDGNGPCYGFLANRALAAPDVPDPPDWAAPVSQVRLNPGQQPEVKPVRESPSQYCLRTAWSPELFKMELRAKTSEAEQKMLEQRVAAR